MVEAISPSLQVKAEGERLYAVCGPRLYSVATIHGGFPDLGWHQPGEMGGVWAPPIKLLDGYWIGIRRSDATRIIWLATATTWATSPESTTLTFDVPECGVRVERREWVLPDAPALVIDVQVRRSGDAARQPLDLCFYARSDLHGAWLAQDRLGLVDGPDSVTYVDALGALVFRDTAHPTWIACVGASSKPHTWSLGDDVKGPVHTKGSGVGAMLCYPLLSAGVGESSLRFLVTGTDGDSAATEVFGRYITNAATLEAARQRHIAAATAPFQTCILASPDEAIDTVFAWVKGTMSQMLLDLPGVGRAPMAGIPDYPWWFGCDIAYGATALAAGGMGLAARDSLSTIARFSQPNGTIVHEVVTNGAIYHAGNLVEIPLFARALYHVYQWTGDRDWLAALLPLAVRGVCDYALTERVLPGEIVPQGASIVETTEMAGSLQYLDVAAYLTEALDLLSSLARETEQEVLATQCVSRAAALRAHVQSDWWIAEEGLFGDVRASRNELIECLVTLRANSTPTPSDELGIASLERVLTVDAGREGDADVRRPWLLYHMVQVLALEAGLPTCEQAATMITRLATPEWTTQYGIVLNALSNRHVMTLPTGAMASGTARYGAIDRSLDYIQRMAATFGQAMPGTLSEFSPTGGSFMQLWSSYAVLWPIISGFFGIVPSVARKRVVCVPQLPTSWPTATLSAVALGDARLDIAVRARPNGLHVHITLDDPTWNVQLGCVVPPGMVVTGATINGVSTNLVRWSDDDVCKTRDTWCTAPVSGHTTYELLAQWAPIASASSLAAIEITV